MLRLLFLLVCFAGPTLCVALAVDPENRCADITTYELWDLVTIKDIPGKTFKVIEKEQWHDFKTREALAIKVQNIRGYDEQWVPISKVIKAQPEKRTDYSIIQDYQRLQWLEHDLRDNGVSARSDLEHAKREQQILTKQ